MKQEVEDMKLVKNVSRRLFNMCFWMIYSLYIIIGCLFKAIWFVLKWTLFLMPTLVIKTAPYMFKLFIFMLQGMMFLACLPFVFIKAILSK
jgi:hypothetical protein